MSTSAIASRIRKLESYTSESNRIVLIRSTSDPALVGTIVPWPNGEGVSLWVHAIHGSNPKAGLSEDQEDAIEPGDRVIVVQYIRGESKS